MHNGKMIEWIVGKELYDIGNGGPDSLWGLGFFCGKYAISVEDGNFYIKRIENGDPVHITVNLGDPELRIKARNELYRLLGEFAEEHGTLEEQRTV